MRRVLHVLRSADPESGGTIEAVTRLALEQARIGRAVDIATLDDPASPWLAAYPLPLHAHGPVSTNYGYAAGFVPWLQDRMPGFDDVIVHGLWQYPGLAVRAAAKSTGVPYVVFAHGMLDPWFRRRYPLKHLKKWLYWPWGEYRVLRDAAAVCFTAEDERLLARQSFWLYRCRERVVTIGTSEPPAQPADSPRLFEDAFPAARGRRVILFLGRIHEKKGCDLLVRAVASLVGADSVPDRPWHLLFAGPDSPGNHRVLLDRLVSGLGLSRLVTFSGMVAGPLKWSTIRAADVLVLPSHQENFGMSVAEALACGLPVLVSDKVNIWREIVAADAGFVEPDNEEGTRRLLARWAALDEPSRQRMRVNARRCFDEHFDVRRSVGRLEAVLSEARG